MVKAFDLLDTELNTVTIPYADEHNELENLDTEFKDLVKELSSVQRRSRQYGDPIHIKKYHNETLQQTQV